MTQQTIVQNSVHYGDCRELMPKIPSGTVDMVCADLPYGTTKNKWDIILDPDVLFKNYWRILKPNGIVVLFGQDKFTAKMMLSNKYHRYNIVWDKVLVTGFLNANRMPLRSHEDIMVFYKKLPTYNPQKTLGKINHSRGQNKDQQSENYGRYGPKDNHKILGDMKHPKSIITFQKPHSSVATHKTAKPVDLIEWLIKSYTNKGDTVLDNTAGSMTTGLACVNTGRKYILMENDFSIYEKGLERLQTHIDSQESKVAVAEKRKENTRSDEV